MCSGSWIGIGTSTGCNVLLFWRLLIGILWLLVLWFFLRDRRPLRVCRPFRYALDVPLHLRASGAAVWYWAVFMLLSCWGGYWVTCRLALVNTFVALAGVPVLCLWPFAMLLRACALIPNVKAAMNEWGEANPQSFKGLVGSFFADRRDASPEPCADLNPERPAAGTTISQLLHR